MKKINLGQTIGILANIGVIAGIVFLAVELKQNNDQLDMQNTITQHQNRVSNIGASIHDESLAAAQLKLDRNEPLTDVERERLYWVHAIKFLNWELAFQLGQFDPRAPIESLRDSPGQLEFWMDYRRYLTPPFVNWIEAQVLPHIDSPESAARVDE